MFDAVQRLTYYFLSVNNNDPDQPDPYPRPGAAQTVEVAASLDDFNAFLKG